MAKVIVLVCWALALAPSITAAQSMLPSQVTPPSFRPDEHRSPEWHGVPSGPVDVKPGKEEGLSVVVRSIVVEGEFEELRAATAALLKPHFGKRLSVGELQQLAMAVEQLYTQAGYVLVRVGIPPQEVKDGGRLRLVVVDGFIEDVDLKAVPDAVRGPIRDRVIELVGQRRITLAAIERRVLLAGEVSGVRLRSALDRGTAEGGVRLILDAEYDRAVGAIAADNRLSDAFGKWQVSASGVLNSVLGRGEQAYVSIGRDGAGFDQFAQPWPMLVFGVGVVIPIGSDGLTINPEYSRSTTLTPSVPFVPATDGLMNRWSLRLAYPVIRERLRTLDARLSAEHIEQSVAFPLFNIDANRDSYSVARGGFDYSAVMGEGLWAQFGLVLSQGLGGRDAADAIAEGVPLSQHLADPRFTKLNFAGRLTQMLPLGMRGETYINAQTSFGDTLLRPEKMVLDGLRALSPFESGSLYADSGATLRVELVRPLAELQAHFAISGLSLEPYVFGAVGKGVLEAPTAVEPSSYDARAYGIGLRAEGPDIARWPRLKGEIEIGYGATTLPYREDEWRLTVLLVTEIK